MSKSHNKTFETQFSVTDFINTVTDETKRNDCFNLITFMQEISQVEPKMWGTSIVGFGSYHYKYESGREGDAPLIAFSPRKAEISLYLSSSFQDRELVLAKLGKHKSAKACVYIKRLSDVNIDVLKQMISLSFAHVITKNETC